MEKVFTYIIANAQRSILSVHACDDIIKRVKEHKSMTRDIYTKQYKCHYLVYYETHESLPIAEERMKRLKGSSREEKLFIIRKNNPELTDLSAEW